MNLVMNKDTQDRNETFTFSKIVKPAELITLPSVMDCHEHSYTQIVIGLKGQADFEIEGYGNRIGPGRGCIVSSNSDHSFGGVIGSSDILVLNLDSSPSLSRGKSVIERMNELSESEMYFCLDTTLQSLIKILVDEMVNHPENELLSQTCNDTLMAVLLNHIKQIEGNKGVSRIDLDAIDRYIFHHISHKISVIQLAGSVYLGESQFHSLFKTQMGITPHQYILNKRVNMAKKYIENGQYTLAQISELTGFSAQSTFTHIFSRLQGMSPSQYKKHYLESR